MDEWIEGENYRKKVLYTEKDLDSEGVRIQLVEVDGGDQVAPHYHKAQTEVYNVQKGEAVLGINDKDHFVKKGDTLICKPRKTHYVINKSSTTFRLLVVKTNYKEKDNYWL